MTRANPDIKVFIGGVEYACTADAMDTAPVMMGRLQVDWGRTEYMSHQEPGTSTVVLYDRSGTLKTLARDRQLIGQHIAYFAGYWSETPGTPKDWIFYHGRVTGIKVKQIRTKARGVKGPEWMVTITSASVEAGMGNIVYTSGATPWIENETMLTRAVRLRDTQTPVTGISQFYFYAGHTGSKTKRIEIKDRDLIGLVREFYMSMGDTYSYLPDQNVIRYLFRRSFAVSTPIRNSVMPRDDNLVHLASCGIIEPDGNGWTYPGAVLPGCEVEAGDEMELSPNVVASRVELDWENWGGGATGNKVTTFLPNPADDSLGRRTVKMETWLADGLQVDPVVSELWNRVIQEGSVPRHPDCVWDTRPFGGFPSEAVARNLVMAGEHQGLTVVNGSPFSEFTDGWAPQYAVIGGTIAYEDGWIVRTVLQQFNNTTYIEPPTWSQLTGWMAWGPTTTPGVKYAYAPSVSWQDMKTLSDAGNLYNVT